MNPKRTIRRSSIAGARVLIAGCGPLGSAFAHALQQQGGRIACVCDVSRSRARRLKEALKCAPRAVSAPSSIRGTFDILVLAVPDDAIAATAAALAEAVCVHKGSVVFHPSGVLPADVLAPLQQQGAQAAALHPVQTFAAFTRDGRIFKDTVFDIQGDTKAVSLARKLVHSWGGKVYVVSAEDKMLLHIASVVSSNFVNVLQNVSSLLLNRTAAADLSVVKALTKTAVHNGFELGPVRALTGPVARGDAETLRMHLAALKEHAPEQTHLYRILSLKAAEMAQEAGLDGRKLQKIIEVLKK